MITDSPPQPDASRQTATTEQVRRYVASIRSDNLAWLRDLASVIPAVAPILNVAPTITLVVDAHMVIGDAIHLARKLWGTPHRTALEEAIASRSVLAIAPRWLEEEMRVKLPVVSETEDIPLDRLIASWERLRPQLRLVATRDGVTVSRPIDGFDPKDAPYVVAWDQFGASAVLTDDRHVAAMGARVAPRQLVFDIRSYARAESVRVTFESNALVVSVAGSVAIDALLGALKAVANWVRRLPPAIHFAAAGLLLTLLLSEKGRQLLGRAIEVTGEAAAATFRTIGALLVSELTMSLAKAYTDAYGQAHRYRSRVTSTTPPRPRNRMTLRYAARAALAAAGEPITLNELEMGVRRVGYQSASPTFGQYLRRVVSEDTVARQTPDGRWALRDADHQRASGDRSGERGAC